MTQTAEIACPFSFDELTDEQVAVLARTDPEAMEHLLERYRRIVEQKVRGYYIVGADHDDVVQEGMIGLYKAVRDYRQEKLANFRTFADMCIARQIITCIKKATRYKHAILNRSLSMDVSRTDSAEDRYIYERRIPIETKDPLFYLERDAFARSLRDVIYKTLSPLEADVFISYMRTGSYHDIASELGCKMKAVDNALQRAKRKLSSALEDLGESSPIW
jgi:RNA polymerase sporulation-specific sigma factor